MLVQVESIEYPGGTIATAVGTDIETGKTVKFGGDWRPMLAIQEALDAGEEPVASVDSWAVIG